MNTLNPTKPVRRFQAPIYTSAHQLTTLTGRELCDLTYFAGCLTAVRTELARIQHRSDTPAEVLEYWREELHAAQAEFDCEFQAVTALHESRCEFAGHKEPTSATGRRLASDAHSVASRRFHAVLNQYAPKLPRENKLALLSNYLRREIASSKDCTERELHDCATDIECRKFAVAELAEVNE